MARRNDFATGMETGKVSARPAVVQPSLARRDKLVAEHLPLVTAVAADLYTQFQTFLVELDLGVLVDAGMTALLNAAALYDDEMPKAFPRYAEDRIRVALLDRLRLNLLSLGSLPECDEPSMRSSVNVAASAGCENHTREKLFAHAADTFGSWPAALAWFSSRCGALNNQTPLAMVGAGKTDAVERILDCIDYGMLA